MPTQNSVVTADRPYPPITGVLSHPLDNLVVVADRGGSEQFTVWAFQINQAVRRTEFINDLPEITNGGQLALGFFGEDGHEQDVNTPGDDRLRISENNEETIQELGIRVGPDDVLVAAKNPGQDVPIIGVQDNTEPIGGSFDIRDASDNDIVQGGFGGVRSQWTDAAGIPTTALSALPHQGLIKIEEQENDNHIRVGFENKTGEDVTPRVDVVGSTYRVANVQDDDTIESMLWGDVPRRLVVWGGLGANEADRTVPDDWNGLDVDGDQVRSQLATAVSGGR